MSNHLNDMLARTSTIPYTTTPSGWSSVHPRPLRPILAHPDIDSIPTPPLPTPPRSPIFHTTSRHVYRLSTHLVPAAYPRLVPDLPYPVIPEYVPGEPSDRSEKLDLLVNQVRQTQDAYTNGKLGGKPSEKLLWNCLNRYVRTSGASKRSGSGVTLFLAHANGLHKEASVSIAVVNAENLNGIYDWLDNSRDIANFLLNYLPEDVAPTVLPTRLQRVPASAVKVREECGYHTRKLVVVGHSLGGCTSLRVASEFPKLFSSFVLVDPIIVRTYTAKAGHHYHMILGAFTRRDRWTSREEAFQLMKKSPFFNVWHPEVLRDFVDHAVIDDPDGGVKLKMPPLQEALTFAHRMTSWETWELLERLDESIALRWVLPKNPLTSKEGTYERVWRRSANASNVVFHFAGHLIVQEAPVELAHDISDFLLRRDGFAKSHL
ncbi:Alpha/Beta hydrolase protein [Chiua virens]|nr:Alpha/Beta hydrolase protein [Chiua virens]